MIIIFNPLNFSTSFYFFIIMAKENVTCICCSVFNYIKYVINIIIIESLIYLGITNILLLIAIYILSNHVIVQFIIYIFAKNLPIN